MSENNTATVEGTDIESRTRRALERVYTVTHSDGTPIRDEESPTVVSVFSGNSAKERRVDVREGRCTCPDHEQFAEHCPGPAVVTSDGGVIEGGTDTDGSTDDDSTGETDQPAGERVRVPVAGGVLVYEKEVHGKQLVGYADVTDWDDLGDAVVARGHSRGDVLHLPGLDA